MNKPASLRAALIAANPHLKTRPEALHTFIESGNIAATLGAGNGWRYHYTLSLLVTDYAGHPDSIFAPLIAWLRTHQPDLLLNQDDRQQIGFEVEVLDDQTYDIAIKLPLTESVVLSEADGRITATHRPEPTVPGINEDDDTVWSYFLNGEPVTWPPQDPDTFGTVSAPDTSSTTSSTGSHD